MPLVGREPEKELLDRLLKSEEAEFLAIYGRRRIGKTFLVREYLREYLAFELTGIQDAPLGEQLENFRAALQSKGRKKVAAAVNWQEAFAQLAAHLKTLPKKRKQVIFFDELPWLAGRRSRFVPALDHFWNTVCSRHPNVVLIVCGSAASWMISKLIHHKGGLHNRVTARMRLVPFTLAETEAFLRSRRVRLTRYDVLMLAMAFGGVPHYLREVRPGESALQAMDRICFSPTGLLVDEFSKLYASLFENPERHLALVQLLARHPQGMDRQRLAEVYASGGRLTETLHELAEAGFISIIEPFGKATKERLYRLTDEFSLFHLRWMAGARRGRGEGFFAEGTSPAWRAWSGYALESLAHQQVAALQRALGVAAVAVSHAGWRHLPDETWPQGAQIDLVLERADHTIHLFEVKFAQGPFTITKAYAAELRRKVETFRAVTGTKKNVFLSFLTPYEVTDNAYARELVQQSLTMDCLFE